MTRFSFSSLLPDALAGNRNWQPRGSDAEPKFEYDVVIVGQDTDGTLTPAFAGKRSLSRPDMLAPNRKQPVGHVTSPYWSAELGRSIALAVIQGGRSLQGRTVHVPMPDKVHAATITGMVFVDPENTRLSA